MIDGREREAELIVGFPAVVCRSVDDTAALAEALAGEIRGGLVIILSGELGAGKTTFTQSMARALEVSGVKSPTFATESVHKIPNRDFDLVHADLYRFDSVPLGSDTDLQFTEYLMGPHGALLIVEWGDRWVPPPEDRWNINILSPDDGSDCRSFLMSACGDDASRRMSRAYESILDLRVAGRFGRPC
jgi:tRNA threonylcarbamoyladenosine biosynthesis protein TsaE